MFNRTTVVVSLLCLALPAATFAQGFTQGDKDLTLEGSGASDKDLDNTAFSLEANLGYFFTDNLEGSIRQGLGFTDVPGSDNDWYAATRVALDYHWDMGRWWPFLGANLGYIYGDQVRNTWVASPEGGVKYFMNETTYVLGLIEYEFFFRDSDNISDAFQDGRFVYILGLGVRW